MEVKNKRSLRNPEFTLTPKQHQIILGGIIGDGNLKKNGNNYYYRECHAIPEREYLEWKFNELGEVTTGHLQEIPARVPTQNPQVGFQTKCSPTFIKYAKLTKSEVISQMNELGVLIWMLDDGWLSKNCKNNLICIAKGTLTEEESNLMIDKLYECGLYASIQKSRGDFRLYYANNRRIKDLTYTYLPRTMDIVEKKINGLIG